MKKKILLIGTICVILISVLLCLTGCGNSKTSDTVIENKNSVEEKKKETLEVNVEDLTISLNSSSSLNNMLYKFPTKATTSSLGTYTIMDYMNGSEFIFRVAMCYFTNKSINQAMEGSSAISKGTKTINGKDWNLYEGKTQDGKKLINYAYLYNKDTYTITFIFDKDISDFIDLFMNNVEFK